MLDIAIKRDSERLQSKADVTVNNFFALYFFKLFPPEKYNSSRKEKKKRDYPFFTVDFSLHCHFQRLSYKKKCHLYECFLSSN